MERDQRKDSTLPEDLSWMFYEVRLVNENEWIKFFTGSSYQLEGQKKGFRLERLNVTICNKIQDDELRWLVNTAIFRLFIDDRIYLECPVVKLFCDPVILRQDGFKAEPVKLDGYSLRIPITMWALNTFRCELRSPGVYTFGIILDGILRRA